jgi:hypothetical protein
MQKLVIESEILVEVYALPDALTDRRRAMRRTAEAFEKLMMEVVIRLVEDVIAGKRPEGSGYRDGTRGRYETRLHYWLERVGRIYRVVILQFDATARTKPILLDGMAIIYGDRQLLARFAAYRDACPRTVTIEAIPTSAPADRPRPEPRPKRPAAPSSLVHRVSRTIKGLLARCASWLATAFVPARVDRTAIDLRDDWPDDEVALLDDWAKSPPLPHPALTHRASRCSSDHSRPLS